MSRNGKVIVAMSGGVDSSVTAALLKEQGYDCVGVFMRVGDAPIAEPSCSTTQTNVRRRLKHGCCSASDALDAKAIATRLGLPFYALNFRADFERIIDYFVDEYAQARTPNPCVQCNIQLKFGKLLDYADLMDAEFVATGHYARVVSGTQGAELHRAANRAKDQSYVLFGIRRRDLRRCLFPLGTYTDKSEVRSIAATLDLRVHDKPDSQEICFVPNNDYKQLVRSRRPETQRAGEIRDAAGNRLGTHEGIVNYTVGQRRGLGIAAGAPIYVTRLDVLSNTVHTGSAEALDAEGLIADRMNWLSDPPTARLARDIAIKIRHQHTPASGSIEPTDHAHSDHTGGENAVLARFASPQRAVTPGQAAVFYHHERVLGGGWIREALPSGDSTA